MEWLHPHEQYVFETHGFCVVVSSSASVPPDSLAIAAGPSPAVPSRHSLSKG